MQMAGEEFNNRQQEAASS